MQEHKAEEENSNHHAECWRVVWGGRKNEPLVLKEVRNKH